MWHFIKVDNWKRELTSRDERAAKKQNMIMLEVKFELNVNGVIGEVADHANVDTATIWETLDIQSKELSEGKL